MNVVAADDTGSLLGAYSLWKVVVTVSQSKLVRMGLCVLWFTIAHMPCEAMSKHPHSHRGGKRLKPGQWNIVRGQQLMQVMLCSSRWRIVILAPDTDELDDQLFQAVVRDDLAAVQQLLTRGANVNAVDHSGNSVLHSAVSRSGNKEVVSLLLGREKRNCR